MTTHSLFDVGNGCVERVVLVAEIIADVREVRTGGKCISQPIKIQRMN